MSRLGRLRPVTPVVSRTPIVVLFSQFGDATHTTTAGGTATAAVLAVGAHTTTADAGAAAAASSPAGGSHATTASGTATATAVTIIRETLATPAGATTQQTLTTSSSMQVGDTLLVIYATDGNTITTDATSTAGTLTQIGSDVVDGNGNTRTRIYRCPVTSGGAQTVTIPAVTGGNDIFGVVLVLGDNYRLDKFTSASYVTSANTFVTPALTATARPTLLVASLFTAGNGTWDTSGTTLVERAEVATTPFSTLTVATERLTNGGAVPTYTVDWTSATASKPGFAVFTLADPNAEANGTATTTTTSSATATAARFDDAIGAHSTTSAGTASAFGVDPPPHRVLLFCDPHTAVRRRIRTDAAFVFAGAPLLQPNSGDGAHATSSTGTATAAASTPVSGTASTTVTGTTTASRSDSGAAAGVVTAVSTAVAVGGTVASAAGVTTSAGVTAATRADTAGGSHLTTATPTATATRTDTATAVGQIAAGSAASASAPNVAAATHTTTPVGVATALTATTGAGSHATSAVGSAAAVRLDQVAAAHQTTVSGSATASVTAAATHFTTAAGTAAAVGVHPLQAPPGGITAGQVARGRGPTAGTLTRTGA